MHRNTYLLVSFLAVFAALLIGVNLGKKLTKPAVILPTAKPVPTIIPTPSIQTYTDTYCGFSLNYPSNFTVLENASGSAILNNPTDKTQAITLTCQKLIPRPTVAAINIETLTIPETNGASVSAKLYLNNTESSGATIDAVIFHHPTNNMDDFIAGFGTAFDATIKTITILP
jgi:hypothetical protein